MQDHQLIFIGGLHRSGTSLLHRCISDHPKISGFSNTEAVEDEGQHLQTVFPPAAPYGGPGSYGFDPEAHFDESHHLATDENARELFRQWSKHWDLEKSYLVEKSPPTLNRSRFLQGLFPDARFVFIIRHPLAVSYATQKWSQTRVHSLLKHWLVCHEAFQKDRPYLNHAHVIRYEAFVNRPQDVLDGIWDFLNLPTIPVERKIIPNVNKKYLNRWRTQSQLHWKWKLYARYIRWRYESRINEFGYSLPS